MKKRLLMLFFGLHLLLIFFQAFWTTIDMYWDVHYDKTIQIPILDLLRPNQYTEPYYVLSGINTGYGFYGIKTATEKYLRCTFFDSSNNVLEQDRYFNLTTSNGISRLEGYASYLANYIADTRSLIELETTNGDHSEAIKLREDYVTKLFKWQGKERAKSIPGCISYKIELITIVPRDTKGQKRKTKPELYVVKESLFPVR